MDAAFVCGGGVHVPGAVEAPGTWRTAPPMAKSNDVQMVASQMPGTGRTVGVRCPMGDLIILSGRRPIRPRRNAATWGPVAAQPERCHHEDDGIEA